MRIQIVADNVNRTRGGIVGVDEFPHEAWEVLFRASCGDGNSPTPAFRLHGAEDIARAVAFVFIINASRYTGFHGERFACVLEELLRFLIDTDHWFVFVVPELTEI